MYNLNGLLVIFMQQVGIENVQISSQKCYGKSIIAPWCGVYMPDKGIFLWIITIWWHEWEGILPKQFCKSMQINNLEGAVAALLLITWKFLLKIYPHFLTESFHMEFFWLITIIHSCYSYIHVFYCLIKYFLSIFIDWLGAHLHYGLL